MGYIHVKGCNSCKTVRMNECMNLLKKKIGCFNFFVQRPYKRSLKENLYGAFNSWN